MTKCNMDYREQRSAGFGLLELMIVLVVAGLLASVAVPSYNQFVDRAKERRAIGDIGFISVEIGKYQLRNNNALPPTLGDLGVDIPMDPWDRAYVYETIAVSGGGKAKFRKDKNLKPLNTDYDLFSTGKDGDYKDPLNAKVSRDDIIRANDGAYIGRAEDY